MVHRPLHHRKPATTAKVLTKMLPDRMGAMYIRGSTGLAPSVLDLATWLQNLDANYGPLTQVHTGVPHPQASSHRV